MLEFENRESLQGVVQKSIWVLLVWFLWLTWISTLPIPPYVTLSCVSLIILFGAVTWSLVACAGVFLLISWFYAQFSFTPAGFMWLSMFVVVCLVKLGSFHFILRTPLQFFLAVLLVSMAFEVFQLTLVSEMMEVSFWHWYNFGAISLSSAIQGFIGAVLFNPIRRVVV